MIKAKNEIKNLRHLLLTLGLLLISINANSKATEEIGSGVRALSDQNYDYAYQFFDSYVKSNPDDGVGYYFRSQAAYYKKNNAQALSDINRALKSGKGIFKKQGITTDDMLIQRGLIYQATHNLPQAIADYTAAIQENGQNINAYINRGKSYAETQQIAQSDSDYTQALVIDETNLDALLGIAQNKISRHQYQEAIATLNNADGLYPEEAAIYSMRGDAYQMIGKKKEAFDDIYRLIQNKDDYNSLLNLLVNRALQCDLYSLPRIGEKIAQGDTPDLWLQARARVYEAEGEYDKAIADYNQLQNILKEPFAQLCVGRGNCEAGQGDLKAAREDYNKALELEDLASGYAGLSQIMSRSGKSDSAYYYINKAIAKNPENADYYYQKGQIKETMADSAEALKDYEMGLNVNAKSSELLAACGEGYWKQNKKDKANKCFEAIVENEKLIQPQGNRKAWALHYLNKEDEALEVIEQTLEDFGTALNDYDAACAYALIGMETKSVEQISQALSKGYTDYNHLLTDKHLAKVRNSAEYAALAQKVHLPATAGAGIVTAKADSSQQPAATTASTTANKSEDLPIIPCTIDGMKLTFTTNSSSEKLFTISLLDVQMLLKYGYMDRKDVQLPKEQKWNIATLPAGCKVVLRSFKWGKKQLRNVEATLVTDPQAPILITQGMLNEIDK